MLQSFFFKGDVPFRNIKGFSTRSQCRKNVYKTTPKFRYVKKHHMKVLNGIVLNVVFDDLTARVNLCLFRSNELLQRKKTYGLKLMYHYNKIVKCSFTTLREVCAVFFPFSVKRLRKKLRLRKPY